VTAIRNWLAAALGALVLAGATRAQDSDWRVPFITTPDDVVERMLALADTGAGDLVMDLGSGDGRIVIAAAQKFGARGLGVEIDGRLVAQSRENARRAGVADRVTFEEGDVLRTDLRRATVVTIYLLPFLIDKLQPKMLEELQPGARIVTHAFPMTGWKPDRTETMRIAKRHSGQGDESRIFLWLVPAEVRGTWQGHDWRLRVSQNFQEIEIEGEAGGKPIVVKEAKIEGTALSFSGEGFAFRGHAGTGRIVGELLRDGTAAPLTLTKE
jgi:protein-L-isoaspartate O-methyltransferase